VKTSEAYLVLNMLRGLGPLRVGALISKLGSATNVLTATRHDLLAVPGIGPQLAANIHNWRQNVDWEGELKAIEAAGARLITREDADYPEPLRQITDAPLVLYVKGSLERTDFPAVAVVGVRQPTHYGSNTAKKIAYQLSYSGLTVVSGLARGVDACAHQAALAAKGRTIAVIGSGLNCLYPPEHDELADRICDSGALLSEFPMNLQADKRTFPMRNRIVSGLSVGVLVIEAGDTSGALITANMAAEQGRTVYAVPGKIDSPKSKGTNRLIQSGAKLVTSAADILDDFGLLFRDPPRLRPKPRPNNLSPDELQIYEALGDDEIDFDAIIARSGLPTPQVSSTLLALEIRKLVKTLPGGRYVKLN